MKRLLVIALLLMPALASADEAAAKESPAYGKISYKDARALYDQLKQPVWDTGLFNKKSFQERLAYMEQSKKLEQKLEVFGVPSQCRSAGITRTVYIRSLIFFADANEGRSNIRDFKDLTDPMYNAFAFGDHVNGCYDEVEVLDVNNLPKK
ncbi:MAG: hypothetical protein M0R33_07180 [Methylomonas sp.]|jgi:hypothetical protein|uniref:hypothetical protein n=1 Tax=Methylomonas sp. TaxID=418 RepID=UPI0025E5E4AE|nr:hypothetical protein [Methylomonas sp.]MCK9606220.1 hypothetical protein [Methylomonas sp.]